MIERAIAPDLLEDIFIDGLADDAEYAIVHRGEWVDEGKYQVQEVVLQDSNGDFWMYVFDKSGSYFTDYHYSHRDESNPTVWQVVPEEKVITIWKTVKGE